MSGLTTERGSGPVPPPGFEEERLPPDIPVLELRKLDKRFTGTHALKGVDLAFRAGEIHAIVGENGAGKSTLIKLLTGVYTRTSGEHPLAGPGGRPRTPHDAIALGINAVHQEVVLCPHLTVAANMFLGEETSTASACCSTAPWCAGRRRSSTSSASTCRPTRP